MGNLLRSDFERYQSVFPILNNEILRAFIRFIVWLTALAFIETGANRWRVPFTIVWIAAFLLVYASQLLPARLRSITSDLRLNSIGRHAPAVIWLCILSAILSPIVRHSLEKLCVGHGAGPATGPTGFDHSAPMTFANFGLAALYTATYPLLEEFFARGWLLSGFESRLGRNLAVIVTSAIFAILHITFYPSALFAHFAFGVFVAYAVLLTNSIWTGVAIHYAWNLSLKLVDLRLGGFSTADRLAQVVTSCSIGLATLLGGAAVAGFVLESVRRRNIRSSGT